MGKITNRQSTCIPNPALNEVLSTIGIVALHDAHDNPEKADAIFSSTVSRFVDRYPDHKIVTPLGEEARQQNMLEQYSS